MGFESNTEPLWRALIVLVASLRARFEFGLEEVVAVTYSRDLHNITLPYIGAMIGEQAKLPMIHNPYLHDLQM